MAMAAAAATDWLRIRRENIGHMVGFTCRIASNLVKTGAALPHKMPAISSKGRAEQHTVVEA